MNEWVRRLSGDTLVFMVVGALLLFFAAILLLPIGRGMADYGPSVCDHPAIVETQIAESIGDDEALREEARRAVLDDC